MIDRSIKSLKTASRRMLDFLGRRLQSNPTLETAEAILHSFTKPWAEVFAYTRLACLADGMVDGWDALPFDLTQEEQHEAVVKAQAIKEADPLTLQILMDEFSPEERILVRPWFGLPPPVPPSDLVIAGGGPDDMFNLRLPTYEWALRELAAKHLVTREQWDELETDEIEQAFTVAGLETQMALDRVRNAIGSTLREGWNLEEFKEAAGHGSFLSEAHAETVFRTNLHQSYSDGKLAVVEHPLVSDAFPYATIDPIGDDRVRKTHLALEKCGLNGTNVYRTDDPVFQTFRPPWDFSCRCGWGSLTIRQAAAKGVSEANVWFHTGIQPVTPEHVAWPMYQGMPLVPNPAFRRAA